MSAIRIMIVENDPGRIQILTAALSKQEGIEIVSAVSTRETAMKQLSSDTDIMILNPAVLKDQIASRFFHAVQAKFPHVRVIHLVQKAPADDILIADIKLGVRGVMKITDSPSLMLKAIHTVNEGEIWAERRILEKAISKPMLLPESLQTQVPGLSPLTNREMEMLTLVLQGASNREIADQSSISERTVKTHLYRVYRKLKVKSRTKAIALLSHP